MAPNLWEGLLDLLSTSWETRTEKEQKRPPRPPSSTVKELAQGQGAGTTFSGPPIEPLAPGSPKHLRAPFPKHSEDEEFLWIFKPIGIPDQYLIDHPLF